MAPKNPEVEIPKKDKGEKYTLPDKDVFNKQVDEYTVKIEALQKEQNALREQIREKTAETQEMKDRRMTLQSTIRTFWEQVNKLQAQKEELQKSLIQRNEQGKQQRQQLQKMKNSIQVSSQEEIDAKIGEIEYTLCTSTVSLQEEKRFLQEISKLKKSRTQVEKIQSLQSGVENLGDQNVPILERLTAVKEKINQVFAEKNKVKEEFELLNGERDEEMKMVKPLKDRVDEVKSQIQKLVLERNECRATFRDEERQYRDYQTQIRQAAAEKKRQEQEKRKEEWEKQKKERQMEKLLEQPFLAETTLLEQTLAFCRTLMPLKEQKVEPLKNSFVHNNPEGSTVLLTKKDRNEEFFFAPTKQKGLRKKSKSNKTETIKHNAETFRLFDALKIQAPVTLADLPGAIEQLDKELTQYQEKVREWERKRDDGTLLEELEQTTKEDSNEENENDKPAEVTA